jgi:cell division protein FtsI (penicillin-binding protein 3)
MNDPRNIQSRDEHEFGKRLGILVAVFAVFMVAIIAMLLNIQVFNVKKYRQKAARQYERVITEKAQRGVILDRHARMLAESIESISFYANPAIVRSTPLFNDKGKSVIDKATRKQRVYDNSGAVAALFVKHLGGNKSVYLKELHRRTGMAVLGRKIPVAKALPLMQEKIPGVWFDKDQQRYYLNVAAQVIGGTDVRNEGNSGLELQLNRELKGIDGTKIYQRSADGRRYPAPDAKQQDPVKGNSVQLTIDADVQSIVEDELAKAVNTFQADASSSIVMDVHTGEIIAMANNPTFDLNQRSTWSAEKSRNRAVTDSYEPGSTFKLIMASAATEVLKRKAEDRVNGMRGIMPIYNLFIRDHEPYGNISFREAIMFSSNIVAAKTAMAVGSEKFYAYTMNYGFGRKTGIGLVGESPGRVRPLDRWDRTTLPWMGYGYQVMATPLQILQAYAAMANDGQLMRPYIIQQVINAENKVVWASAPKVVRKAVLPQTARYLSKEYFKAVVDSGTAKSAAVPGVTVAGKTGTARRAAGGSYSKPVYVSSFVGYFPVEAPRYAIIVVVENPKTAYYAAMVAAPVFSSIASRMIACSGEMQKKLAFRSTEQAAIDSVSTVVVPELTGLQGRDAQRLLQWHNLEMASSGDMDGYVARQSIAPGQKVQKKTIIKVTIGSTTMKRNSSWLP